MQRQRRLLLHGLYRGKPHARSANCLTDRLGIEGVALTTPHVRFDVSCRHHAHIMPKLGELTRPMMRCAACFNSHQAVWQFCKKADHLPTTEPASQDDVALYIHTVHLE